MSQATFVSLSRFAIMKKKKKKIIAIANLFALYLKALRSYMAIYPISVRASH